MIKAERLGSTEHAFFFYVVWLEVRVFVTLPILGSRGLVNVKDCGCLSLKLLEM